LGRNVLRLGLSIFSPGFWTRSSSQFSI
jgi:hypothetical protein